MYLQMATLKFTGFWTVTPGGPCREGSPLFDDDKRRGHIFVEWQVELKNYGLGAFLDWMCHFHVHVMIINHCVHTVNRLENTVRNHKFCFGQFRFFCMWNILNSEMDKFATCGHGRSMLPRMNFTTIYLEGITVIPNWHLLLLFYSVDYCANLWQLLFD